MKAAIPTPPRQPIFEEATLKSADELLAMGYNPSVGDYVKVALHGADTTEAAWLEIVEVGPVGINGTLVSEPINAFHKSGDRICREWECIMEWRPRLLTLTKAQLT